jgi:hypothetical protein
MLSLSQQQASSVPMIHSQVSRTPARTDNKDPSSRKYRRLVRTHASIRGIGPGLSSGLIHPVRPRSPTASRALCHFQVTSDRESQALAHRQHHVARGGQGAGDAGASGG